MNVEQASGPLARLRAHVCASWFVGVAGLACSSGVSPLDAGVGADATLGDAETRDASTPRVDAGETTVGLLTRPAEVQLAPDTLVCLEFDWIYDDGRRAPVGRDDGIELEVSDGSLAVAAAPEDCDGVGIIGRAPGQATVRVLARGPGLFAETRVPIRIEPASVELTLYGATILVGTESPLVEPRVRLVGTDGEPRSLPDVQILPRLLTLDVEDPSIARVRFDAALGRHLVRGEGPGTTSLTGRYGSADAMHTVHGTILTVPRAGTLSFIDGLALALDDRSRVGLRVFRETGSIGANAPSTPIKPGTCFEVIASGLYADPDGNTWSQPIANVALEVSEQLVAAASGAGFCARENADGDAWVHACVDGDCVRSFFAIGDPAEYVALSVTPPSEPVAKSAEGRYCPPLSVAWVTTEGALVDVTASSVATWWSGFEYELQRARQGWGVAVDNGDRPCFEVSPWPDERITLEFSVEYAGFSAQSSLELLP